MDHSSRLIAYYNGEPGGTMEMIRYALGKNVRVIANREMSVDEGGRFRKTVIAMSPTAGKPKKYISDMGTYPENILRAIGLEKLFGQDEYRELDGDQLAGLTYVLSLLHERDQEFVRLRYQEGKTQEESGKQFGLTRQRAQQIDKRIIQ